MESGLSGNDSVGQGTVEDRLDGFFTGDPFQSLLAVHPKIGDQLVGVIGGLRRRYVFIKDLNGQIPIGLILTDQLSQQPVGQSAVGSPGCLDICDFFHVCSPRNLLYWIHGQLSADFSNVKGFFNILQYWSYFQ